MQLPIYTQQQADAMIALPKRAVYEAQMYAIAGQHRSGFAIKEFAAHPEDLTQPVRFKILTQANFDLDAYSITLLASWEAGPWQALCRYDVHDSYHPNDNCVHCGPPPGIEPGVLHVHRYNEAAIRDDWTWDKCATPLAIDPEQPLHRQLRQLIGLFVQDMQIRFSDSTTANALFESGNP